jgi:WD40 repeat protein
MGNRGRTFLQEIRDAVEAMERVIAVVGPNALKSEYVLYEWEYALLFCKSVVPILRQGEYSSIPEDLRKLHCPDFREQRPYPQAFEELLRLLREPVPPLGPLRATPALPPHFLPRRDDISRLQQDLFADIERPNASAQPIVVLQGMGGVGKSVLAAAFARAVNTRRACGDGILWLTVGQDPGPAGILPHLKFISLVFDDDPKHYIDEPQARSRLPQVLEERSCLIVLDDVWHVSHAEPFVNALGPRCRLLVTTRDGALATALGASAHRVNVLTIAEALILLSKWSGQPLDALPPVAREVVEECGSLPLALAMIGAMVRDNPERWENALHKLRNADLEKIKRQFPNYPYPDLLRAIQVSVDALEPNERSRYLELAVFPPDTAIPEAALQILWGPEGLDKYAAQDVSDRFVQRSLARRDEPARITLHDLQCDFVRKQTSDLPGLHRRLLNTYEERCTNGWSSGPNDGYFFQFLAYHLVQAGEVGTLHDLLFDYEWIQAKLQATDVQAVIADYNLATQDADLRRMQQALRLSAHVLSGDKSQLPGQLLGRLQGSAWPQLERLVEKAHDGPGVPWLCPQTASLIPPGSSLLRTIPGGSVARRLVAIPNTRRLLAGTDAGTVELVDLDDGRVVHVFAGHSPQGRTMAVTPDGRFAVSGASSSSSLNVWNLETLDLAHTLEGHSQPVSAVAVSPDGRRAVSSSEDGTFCVWDIGAGSLLHRQRAHEGRVTAIAMTAQGDRIVSGSEDGTLKVWDLESGRLCFTLGGQTRGTEAPTPGIEALVVTVDGRRAISADRSSIFTSKGGACRIWDLENGALLHALERIYGGEHALAVSHDGRYAVTGKGGGVCSVFDVETGALVRTLDSHDWFITAVAISSDSRRVLSAAHSGVCWLWDLETGMQLQTLIGHGARVNAAAILADGTWAVTASNDGTYRVWNLLTEAPAFPQGHTRHVNDVSATPCGRRAISASEDGTLKVWDVDTGVLLRNLTGHASGVLRLKVIEDQQRVASVSRDNTLRVWNFETGACLYQVAREGWDLRSAAFTNDGRLACTIYADGQYDLHDLMAGEIRLAHRRGEYIRDECLLTPDGKLLLSADLMRRHVTVWDLETDRLHHMFDGYRGGIAGLALTPDGQHAVFPLEDGRLSLWDLHSGTMIRVLEGNAGLINYLRVTPDGRYAVSGSGEGIVALWSLEGGSARILSGRTSMVWGLAISPDGQRTVTGSADHTCRVWDLSKLRLLATFQADTAIGAVSWAGDRCVLAASHDGAVHILRLKE